MTDVQHLSKAKLLDATLKVVRVKGYTATRIEDVCAEAGVTKGSFFHHFKSKHDLALSAAAHWDSGTRALFADAPYHTAADPLERLLGYIDLRKAMLTRDLAEITCFAGTIIQEAWRTNPALRDACAENVVEHAKELEADIAAAMRQHGTAGPWTAESLALHTQVVIQGAFVLAKAKGDVEVAAESLDHLRRYIELLFKGRPDDTPASPDAPEETLP